MKFIAIMTMVMDKGMYLDGTRGNVTDIRDTKLLQFYQNAKNDESFLLVKHFVLQIF